MVQAGGVGVMVWGIFSWHTLGPLVPIEHCLNATAYPSIVADYVHPFMTTVYPCTYIYIYIYIYDIHYRSKVVIIFLKKSLLLTKPAFI